MSEALKPLYLLIGEEFLIRKAADQLVQELLPDGVAGVNHVTLDAASPREVAQELATMPLFPGRKVVVVRDPEFMLPKKRRGDGLAKAKEAWKAGRRKEAARRILGLAGRAGWSVEQIDPAKNKKLRENWARDLDVELGDADLSFLREVAEYCREERLVALEGDVSPLTDLFGKGVPEGHTLLLLSSEIDLKNPLIALARKLGKVIDRPVSARLKDVDISGAASEVLGAYGKRLGSGAEQSLRDRCGANMRLLQSELEKLALYQTGPVISLADVELLIGRARQEEFMELSDALQRRDLSAALRYLTDALNQGTHPLPLLGTIASIIRTLIENHTRLSTLVRGPFRMTFNDFKDEIFPKIQKEAEQAEQRVPHPYAAYVAMQAAGRYQKKELVDSLVACADADLQLKSGGNGRLVLERLLWNLSGRAAA